MKPSWNPDREGLSPQLGRMRSQPPDRPIPRGLGRSSVCVGRIGEVSDRAQSRGIVAER